MANEVYEKWLEYYDNNGLSWLATQVQASIKQAFFAGYEAAEQSVQLTGGTCAACGEGNVVYDGCCISCGVPATSN